jgi:hypothetical protein
MHLHGAGVHETPHRLFGKNRPAHFVWSQIGSLMISKCHGTCLRQKIEADQDKRNAMALASVKD